MAAVINISESLAVGGKIAMFVVRNRLKFTESDKDIQFTAISGFPCDDSISVVSDGFAKTKGESAYSLCTYSKFSFHEMRTVTKNCKAGNNSTRTATPNSAKTVSPIYLKGQNTKLSRIIEQLRQQIQDLQTPERLYRVHLLFYYNVGFDQRRYEIDKHYYARSREEALGKAYYEMRITKPDYNLPLTKAGGVELCTLVK